MSDVMLESEFLGEDDEDVRFERYDGQVFLL